MVDALPGLRFELKLACQESAHAEVLEHLLVHPVGLRRLHPERIVQSLYFDTPHQRALEENLAGISRREKLRLRWYGEEARGVRARLERKGRRNALGWKRVHPIEEPLDVEGASAGPFTRALLAATPEDWMDLRSLELQPAQWVRYRRAYYQSADGLLRVTLDRELQSYDQRLAARIERRLATPLPRLAIVEVKGDPEREEEARKLVEHLPIRVDKCSKFVLASAPGQGPSASLY